MGVWPVIRDVKVADEAEIGLGLEKMIYESCKISRNATLGKDSCFWVQDNFCIID